LTAEPFDSQVDAFSFDMADGFRIARSIPKNGQADRGVAVPVQVAAAAVADDRATLLPEFPCGPGDLIPIPADAYSADVDLFGQPTLLAQLRQGLPNPLSTADNHLCRGVFQQGDCGSAHAADADVPGDQLGQEDYRQCRQP
jgi:hypothetical protein